MNFEDFYQHDAVIKNITVDRDNPGLKDEVALEIVWPNTEERVHFIFESVYWTKMELNLGIVADENISQGRHLSNDDRDLIRFYSQWNDLMDDVKLNVYEIELSSTGGRIKIIAKGFRINQLSIYTIIYKYMRYLLIAIYEKTALFGSIILIAYRIFLPYIYKVPYLSSSVQIIFLIFWAITLIGGMMSYLFPYIRTPKRPLKAEGIIRTFYLKSDKIIMQVYCFVFGAYAIFYLDRVSVLFDYLMLLLLGVLLGYRMAVRANAYSLDEASKKKQVVKKESHTR